MKTRMRPRYYCDHCGKGSGSPSAMRRHESSCTLNPARVCRMCTLIGDGSGFLGVGKAAFLVPEIAADWRARMKALRDAVENCPCCILAVLRQTGAVTPVPDEEGTPFPPEMYWASEVNQDHTLLGFDFKAEMAERLREHNERESEYPP